MPALDNGKSPLNARRLCEIIEKFHTTYPQIFRGGAGPRTMVGGIYTFKVMMGRRIRPDKPNAGINNIRIERVTKVDLMTLNAVIQGQGGPSAQTAINLVQAMICQAPMHATQTYNTRSIFHNQDTQTLGNIGLELWRGYFQRICPSIPRAHDNLASNVDMSTAVVYKNIKIVDFAMQYLGFRDLGQLVMMHPGSKEWKLLKSVLKGSRIITTVPPTDRQKNPRPIKDLIPQAGLYELKIGNKSWTVQSMRFPTGWGIGFAGDAVVPPEVCVIIPGQLYRKKVPPANMKTVLDFSAKNPRDRLQIIEQGINSSFLNYHQSDSLGLAGIKVGMSAMEIKGRMLDAPQVAYASSVLANTVGKSCPRNWNVLRNQFFSPGRLVKWVVVNLAGTPQEAANFAVELLNACRALGMECQPASAVLDDNPSYAWATLENAKRYLADWNNPKSPPLLVAVVLPDSAAELWRLVKLWGDSANGVPTQCVRKMKLRPINNQYNNNVALKVNAKLGGVNSIARGPVSNLINQTPTMIIGANVSHPGPGVQRPSIASVVASYDPYLRKYSTFVTLQMP
ncbi:Piwi-domain-containing protein [Stereum hirsutum FP-91666 SS1]|uniref:Piwi-domain-containing protein n=1 Tax=Stereum hirsutum (strain FP-91666) TaxID=721885 RepID=R7RXN1_STEHR|nr:Piwi-domain-containing protein [Stereum hirsutum FP-91666 SS1]EIM79132.1 Piwi-domain-containing protein [Stereum hirsutum FP-91666 SS1]